MILRTFVTTLGFREPAGVMVAVKHAHGLRDIVPHRQRQGELPARICDDCPAIGTPFACSA